MSNAVSDGINAVAGGLAFSPLLLAVIDPLAWGDVQRAGVYSCMAVAGAALALAAESKDWPGWRWVLTRCAMGAFFGFLFGPYLADRMNLGGDASAQFAAGGGVGVASWYLLKIVVEQLPSQLAKWVSGKLPGGAS